MTPRGRQRLFSATLWERHDREAVIREARRGYHGAMRPEGRSGAGKPDLLRAALSYARRGVPVFPCRTLGKTPLTTSGHLDATREEGVVRTWWGRWPNANVGIPTGKRSGLLVLDVDPEDGGIESLKELERAGGEAPRTARARTGGGGLHLYFRYPRSSRPESRGVAAEVRNSASLLGPGLDVRAEGGYVVVPPSRTEAAYEWVDRSAPAPPAWLVGLLAERSGEQTLF